MRYLLAKKSHTAVSIISAISACAVAVTALAMVCVMSVFNGFNDLIGSKLSSLEPQVRVSSQRGVIDHADAVIAKVKATRGVIAAEPTVTENALVLFSNRQMPVMLKGIPDNYDQITDIKKLIRKGGEFKLTDGDTDFTILSIGAAVTLNAFPGDDDICYLYAPRRAGAVNVANPATAFVRCETAVSAVFEMRQGEYDSNYVYTSLRAARRLFDYTDEATAVEIRLDPAADEAAVIADLQQRLGKGYKVENRLQQHRNSLKMINVEKWISMLLLVMILVVASFNVISTIAILILEKTDNIRTLRSLGADDRMTRAIFVIEGWLISIIGSIVGIAGGVALCLIQKHYNLIRLSSDTTNLVVDTYPVAIQAGDLLTIFAVIATVGLVASWVTTRAMRSYLRS